MMKRCKRQCIFIVILIIHTMSLVAWAFPIKHPSYCLSHTLAPPLISWKDRNAIYAAMLQMLLQRRGPTIKVMISGYGIGILQEIYVNVAGNERTRVILYDEDEPREFHPSVRLIVPISDREYENRKVVLERNKAIIAGMQKEKERIKITEVTMGQSEVTFSGHHFYGKAGKMPALFWRLRGRLFDIGKFCRRKRLIGHGVRMERKLPYLDSQGIVGINRLLNIILEQNIRPSGPFAWYGMFGAEAGDTNPHYYGPYYIILKSGITFYDMERDFPQGIVGRFHALYLVPQAADKRYLGIALDKAVEQGVFSADQSARLKEKIMTYAEFLRSPQRVMSLVNEPSEFMISTPKMLINLIDGHADIAILQSI